MDYRTLIGEILSGAIRRYKEREQRKGGNGAPKSGYEERTTIAPTDALRIEAKA